jgi:hypothetical protein
MESGLERVLRFLTMLEWAGRGGGRKMMMMRKMRRKRKAKRRKVSCQA